LTTEMADLEKRVRKGEHVEIMSVKDGDGHELSITVSEAGFMIHLTGENHEPVENPHNLVSTETWIDFRMLGRIFGTMSQYGHLVKEEE
jgi:hypothetical protein